MADIDPRIVANTLLALAWEEDEVITNLSLQKLLYFVHGMFLIRFSQPLVSGYFEAWEYGPVHPVVYSAFKDYGARPINSLAKVVDNNESLLLSKGDDIFRILRDASLAFIHLSTGRLIDLSHAKDSPWDVVSRLPNKKRGWGMRISNALIETNFCFHKISIGDQSRIGEPNEEIPPDGYRPSKSSVHFSR